MAEHLFHTKLREKLQAEIESEASAICEGSADDYADYRNRVGRLSALRDALEMSVETQSELLGERK